VVEAGHVVRKLAMLKNGYLRLLMTLIGFQRIGLEDDPDTTWVVPSTLSADQIQQALDLIKKFEFSPPVFDDGKEAGDFVRRKSAGIPSRRKAVFDDEDEGIDDDEDEELLFPAGGPTARKKSDALEALKKNRRRRGKEGTDEGNGITDEQLRARAEARRQRELEKNRKIKSELFIRDSDDETDEERDRIFFEQEEKLRQSNKINIMRELLGLEKGKGREGQTKKRQSSAISADSDDDEVRTSARRQQQTNAISIDSDGEVAGPSGVSSPAARDNVLAASDDETTDTPMSSPHARPSQTKRRKLSSDDEPMSSEPPAVVKDLPGAEAISDDEDEVVGPVARSARHRVRAGFIVDTSDDE
jgi:replication fork protection complex subunit Tof1/Swi1